MGLRLGRLVGKALKLLPTAAAGFAQGGFAGSALALGQRALTGGTLRGGAGFMPGGPAISVGAGVPSIMTRADVGDSEIRVEPAAGALPAIIAGMNRVTALAIARLAAALGIPFTIASLGRVGMRIWRTMMQFARRHPGVSIIGLLTALGLAADEAAQFLSWGATRQRRRRARGISGRDLRICRRTIRRMAAFQRDLGGLRRRPGPGRRSRDGTIIAQN